MREGEIWANRQGYEITILKYNNSLNCDIQFNDNKSTILECVQYGNIKRGNINNPFHPSVYGVGFIGNGGYNSKIKGKSTKTYKTWSGILERCYSEKYQSKNPTYKNTTICEEWKCFQVFAQWYEENYDTETMQGWQIDKDIMISKNAIDMKIEKYRSICIKNIAKLDALSPLKTLTRGYSVVENVDGKIVKKVSDVNKNDDLCVILQDGKIQVKVK